MITWENFFNISNSLDTEGYTLFFKKNGNYYVATEDNRIIFAKIKSHDTEDMTADEKVSFVAKNISTNKKEVFIEKDMPEIEVCDKKEIIKQILKSR